MPASHADPKLSCSITLTTVMTLSLAFGCAPASPDAEVEDLIKINAPLFDDQSSSRFSSPSKDYVVHGSCDPKGSLLEYSFDQSTWTAVPAGCDDAGNFQIPVRVNSVITVYVRSKGKFKYTDTASARIVRLLPPTSPALEFAASSKSMEEGQEGTQNLISLNFSGEILESAFHRLANSLVGIVYDSTE